MSPDSAIAALSNREREVLDAVACGYKHEEVALHLGISPRTVHTHMMNIRHKLGDIRPARLLQIAFAAGMGEPL